jgi:rod shape-determining protein MreC
VLFHRTTGLGLRTLSLSFLMMGLMIADYHYQYVNSVRNTLSVLLTPLQYTVDVPVNAIDWLKVSAATQHKLTKENVELKQQLLLMQVKMQQLINMQQENSQLRALLKSSSKINGQVQAAKLLEMNIDNNSAQVVLDKGSQQNVAVGQIVIDVSGIMGQIIGVTPYTSRLLLVSDPRSGVPVEDDRTGFQAIVVGNGQNQPLSLINASETADIKVGDSLVTSDLGQRYPEGYPVGQIISINKVSGEPFLEVKVAPSALLTQSRRVLIVSHYLEDNHQKMLYEANSIPLAPMVKGRPAS